jgi:hypothetical protein
MSDGLAAGLGASLGRARDAFEEIGYTDIAG